MFLSRHRFEPGVPLNLPEHLGAPSYPELLTPGKDPVYGRHPASTDPLIDSMAG